MWWLTAAAALAFPVSLPTGESRGAWTAALEEAGLQVGPAALPPHATIAAVGTRWRVTVVDARGVAHQVIVTPADTDAARSDLGWLMVSLARPTRLDGLPELPPLPPPAPASRAPEPQQAPAPAPPVQQPTTAAQPKPVPVDVPPGMVETLPVTTETLLAEALPEVPAEELPPDDLLGVFLPPSVDTRRQTSTGIWGRASLFIGLRDEAAAPGAELAVGPAIGVVRVGFTGSWTAPTNVVAAGAGRRVRTIEGLIGTWWTPQTGALLGLSAGWSERTWSDERTLVARDGLPVLAVDAGGALSLGGGWRILPALRLQQDLATTTLTVDGAPVGRLAPTTVTLRVGLDGGTLDPSAPPRAPGD